MEDWKKYAVTQKVLAVRKGWPGVWDALVSAITRRPRAGFLEDITFSIMATQPIELRIAQAQVEKGKGWDV